jgi:hypothetical protein
MTTITVPKYDYAAKRYTGERVTPLMGPALQDHLQRTYRDTSSRAMGRYMRAAGVHPSDVFKAVAGILPEDFNATGVRAILSNDQLLPWFGPITEDGFRLGFQDMQQNWEQLIATTIDVGQMSMQWYTLQDAQTADDYALKAVGQGGDIPVATITVSGKNVGLTKKGKGIEWTDEAKDAPVALAQLWLRILGIRMGMSYWKLIAYRLINGYLDDGSDLPTIVLTTTPGTFTLADLRRAKSKLENDLGFPCTDVVLNGDLRITLETATVGTSGNLMIPNGDLAAALDAEVHENTGVDLTNVVFMSRAAALVRLVNKPFGTEDARNAQRQVTATYGSMIDQVVIGTPGSVVVLDSTP